MTALKKNCKKYATLKKKNEQSKSNEEYINVFVFKYSIINKQKRKKNRINEKAEIMIVLIR